MGESNLGESLKKAINKPEEVEVKKEDSKKPKNKKPIIKKNKLDLKKKRQAKNSLKKSNASLIHSSVINEGALGGSKKEVIKKKKNQIWPNKETFENFLKTNNIRFVKKDTLFLLSDLGSIGECLYEDRFNRFLNSNVWQVGLIFRAQFVH